MPNPLKTPWDRRQLTKKSCQYFVAFHLYPLDKLREEEDTDDGKNEDAEAEAAKNQEGKADGAKDEKGATGGDKMVEDSGSKGLLALAEIEKICFVVEKGRWPPLDCEGLLDYLYDNEKEWVHEVESEKEKWSMWAQDAYDVGYLGTF